MLIVLLIVYIIYYLPVTVLKCNIYLLSRLVASISGISRDKTIADNLIYIHNDDTQNTRFLSKNYWLKSFYSNSLELTNQEVPKVL